jgi:hypothetical protein
MSKAKQAMQEASKGCLMYEPCPMCFKCMAKASHLYDQCQNCEVPFCGHNHKQRSFMIRRENFGIAVTKETGEKFLEASEMCRCHEKGDSNE